MLLMNDMFINIISILDTNNANNSNFNDDNYNYNYDNISIKTALQHTNNINFQIPSSNVKECIVPYSDYQLDGLKEFLRCIRFFLDRKKDFKDKMQILKIVINQVEKSSYNDMTAIIPIIIDFMNNNQEIYRSKSKHLNHNNFNWKFILKIQKTFYDDDINSDVVNFLRNYLSNYSIDESKFILFGNDKKNRIPCSDDTSTIPYPKKSMIAIHFFQQELEKHSKWTKYNSILEKVYTKALHNNNNEFTDAITKNDL